ncbi:MAG: hypothetical protein WCC21_07085 [Candidatus Acidiferrales bacterium]
MKPLRRVLGILAVALAALLQSSSSGAGAQQQNNTPIAYIGYVMDSVCAGGGSHAAMESKEGIKTAKDCVLYCVKNGAKFVLYIPETKTDYNLDDPDKSQDYAGEKVNVVGSYDGPSKTIHIISIMVSP